MLGSDLYLDRNTCSLTVLALSPSVLFCLISFSVKIIWKHILTWIPEKNGECLFFATEIQTLLWTAREFSAKTTQSTIQKPTLWQWKVARITHAPPKTGHITRIGKQTKPQNTSRNINDLSLRGECIFVCWKFRCRKYTQIVWVNRCETTIVITEPFPPFYTIIHIRLALLLLCICFFCRCGHSGATAGAGLFWCWCWCCWSSCWLLLRFLLWGLWWCSFAGFVLLKARSKMWPLSCTRLYILNHTRCKPLWFFLYSCSEAAGQLYVHHCVHCLPL